MEHLHPFKVTTSLSGFKPEGREHMRFYSYSWFLMINNRPLLTSSILKDQVFIVEGKLFHGELAVSKMCLYSVKLTPAAHKIIIYTPAFFSCIMILSQGSTSTRWQRTRRKHRWTLFSLPFIYRLSAVTAWLNPATQRCHNVANEWGFVAVDFMIIKLYEFWNCFPHGFNMGQTAATACVNRWGRKSVYQWHKSHADETSTFLGILLHWHFSFSSFALF